MKKILFLFILSLFAITGCNHNSTGLYEKDNDSSGARLLSNKKAGVEDDYTMDRTMSDQNPNFPNFDGGRLDDGNDIDKARKVIRMAGYKPGSIWMNAEDMWVTAYTEGDLSQKEQKKAEDQLYKKLLGALPRYHINLELKENE